MSPIKMEKKLTLGLNLVEMHEQLLLILQEAVIMSAVIMKFILKRELPIRREKRLKTRIK